MDPRSKIIENSLELFIQKGCKVVTMDDIARENGVSKRTIYELFTDKSHLLEECLMHLYGQMDNYIANYKGKYDNVFDSLFSMHAKQSDNLMDLKKNFFEELKRYYYGVFKKSINYFLEFHKTVTSDFILRGQKEGLIRTDINNEIVIKAIIEISNVMENSEFFSLKEYSRKELFKEIVLSYIRGLCTDEGKTIIDSHIAKMDK